MAAQPARPTATSIASATATSPTLLDVATLRRPRVLSERADRQHSVDVRARVRLRQARSRHTPTRGGALGGAESDPFSTYRAGFEVRTYRLCRRVLMFHDFPSEFEVVPRDPEIGPRRLVRSLDLSYRTTPEEITSSDPGYSFLQSATQWSYQRRCRTSGIVVRSLRSSSSTAKRTIDDHVRDVDSQSLENLPIGLGAGYQWIDLDGEGLSGILTEQAGAWFYKPNLGDGPVRSAVRPDAACRLTALPRRAQQRPTATDGCAGQRRASISSTSTAARRLSRARRATRLEAVHPLRESAQHRLGRRQPALRRPHRRRPRRRADHRARGLHLVSLAGGGRLRRRRAHSHRRSTNVHGPRIVFADGDAGDLPRRHVAATASPTSCASATAQVCYWPNLGYGRFGAQVVMDHSPWFDHPTNSTSAASAWPTSTAAGPPTSSISVATARGCGSTAAATAGASHSALPFPVATSNVGQIQVADLLGNGTACLVWSSDLPDDARRPMRYLDLMGGQQAAPDDRDAQQPRRGDDRRLRAFDEVLPAGQGRRHAVGHAAAVPGALRREGHRHRPAAQHAFSPTPTATTTATSTASSASSAASAASSRWTRSASTKFAAGEPRAARSSPPTRRSISRRSRPSPGSTPASPPIARAFWRSTSRSTFPSR